MPRAVAPPSPTDTHKELCLSLELERESGSALLRVVSTLHRRRCRVLHASLGPAEHGRDQLDLVVQAPQAHAHSVEHWLGGLVDVRRTETRPTSSI